MGAILVFGLAILMLVLIQAFAVPSANAQVEFEHNHRVQDDMAGVEQTLDLTAIEGDGSSTRIEAGVRYPVRFFLLNPGPASGSLRTNESSFVIDNARAIDTETAQFWNGNPKDYRSNTLQYRPNYNVYARAPTTTYEHGLLYNSHPDNATTFIGTPDVVEGNRITLIALDGRLSRTSAAAIDLRTVPLSAPMQRVTVEDTGDPIELRLRSDLSESAWQTLLSDEANVQSVRKTGSTVTITLDPGTRYDLRLAKVGVGSGYTEEAPAYVTKIGARPRLIELGGNQLVVEVRDRFNTAKSGVDVTYTLTDGDGTFIDGNGNTAGETATVTTSEDGQAEIAFKPTSNATVTITAIADLDDDGSPDTGNENATVVFGDLAVIGGGGGGSGEINPNDADSVTLVGASLDPACGPGGADRCVAYVTFQNHGGTPASVDETRVNFFSPSALGGRSGTDTVDRAVINGTIHDIGGQFVNTHDPGFPVDIPAGGTVTYEFEFQYVTGSGYQNFEVLEGDWFVYTVRYADGTTSRYFIAPRD